jgi:hypothetical protein
MDFPKYALFINTDTEDTDIEYPNSQDVYWSDEDSEFLSGVPAITVRPPDVLSVHFPKPIIRSECVICLDKLQNKSRIVYCFIHCGNMFHRDCVACLVKCPMCRNHRDFKFFEP